jgi:hypothetical protein
MRVDTQSCWLRRSVVLLLASGPLSAWSISNDDIEYKILLVQVSLDTMSYRDIRDTTRLQ